MTASSSGSRGSITGTFPFLVLLVLKLTHVIDWSWWWVCAPLWGVAGLMLVILGVVAVVELPIRRSRSAR